MCLYCLNNKIADTQGNDATFGIFRHIHGQFQNSAKGEAISSSLAHRTERSIPFKPLEYQKTLTLVEFVKPRRKLWWKQTDNNEFVAHRTERPFPHLG
jgi:hypothetical protein